MASNGLASLNFPQQQSGLINDQLVPVYPVEQFQPVPVIQPLFGVGAGANTLAGASGGMGQAGSPGQVASSTAAASQSGEPAGAAAGSSAATVGGIPTVLLWILGAVVVGYILLWRVHWHAGESAAVGG